MEEMYRATVYCIFSPSVKTNRVHRHCIDLVGMNQVRRTSEVRRTWYQRNRHAPLTKLVQSQVHRQSGLLKKISRAPVHPISIRI